LAAFGIERLHSVTTPSGLSTPQRGDCSHLDLDTEHTLTEKDVPHCVVHEIASRLTRVNHEPIGELHGFGTGGTEFSGDDDFASFGTGLHHKAEDTVARAVQGPSASHHEARRYAEVMHYTWREDWPTHSKPTKELVPQRLGLSHSAQPAELHLLGIKLKAPLGELESLLDESLEFANPTSFVAEDFLGVRRADDDLGSGVGHAHLAAGVSFFGELAGAAEGEGERGRGQRVAGKGRRRKSKMEDAQGGGRREHGVDVPRWMRRRGREEDVSIYSKSGFPTHKNSPSSAWKTPSATNFLFLLIWAVAAIVMWLWKCSCRRLQSIQK